MQLIKPSFEILEQGPGLQGIYKQIELAGRTCYKSLDKITEDSAEGFVNRMVKSQHYAMLEHGTVYLTIVDEVGDDYLAEFIEHSYGKNPYSRVNEEVIDGKYYYFITTNYRVLVENGWLNDLKYLCEPTEFHEKRVTVKFVSNIHFYKDLTRHRTMSFAIESTRYCNYSKDKFGNELTFIMPIWYDEKSPALGEALFTMSMKEAEKYYLALIESGWKAQQAAEVLPQATKADIVMTGFVNDWNYVFDLRARGKTGAPHPEVKRLMDPLMHEFETQNLI